jgi:transcriptional regulator with XRE-family HTH domain
MRYFIEVLLMNEVLQRIERLRNSKKMSQYKLCNELEIRQSTYNTWIQKNRTPMPDKLQKIADYFNVTIDYLMTGEEKDWHPTLNENDEKDIQKQLQRTLDQLENETGLMFDGNYMDEQAKEKLKNSLELVMRGTRIEAKEKFTPKKYKK